MTATDILVLPPVPHFPGRTPRPPDAVFAAFKRGLSPAEGIDRLAASPAFRAARQAFASRYYWESHELLEAVWACLPPACAERLLLRGLIQLANAGLKGRMGRAAAARRILGLAESALSEVAVRVTPAPMGLAPAEIEAMRAQAAAEISAHTAL